MTDQTVEKPRPSEKVVKSYKKGKRRGRRWAGFFMAIGGGVVGTVYGIGSGMKDVITELLPDDAEDETEEAPSAPTQAQVPPFLSPQPH